jgi:hypothetical protein
LEVGWYGSHLQGWVATLDKGSDGFLARFKLAGAARGEQAFHQLRRHRA